jgi:hypothetical protein
LLAARVARVLPDRAPWRQFLARYRNAFAEGELAGVDLDPPLRLGAEELLLEPAQLLLDFLKARLCRLLLRVGGQHKLDQLVPTYLCKILTPHVFFLTHLTSKAKGNAVD